MQIQSLRGMRDIYGDEIHIHNKIIAIARTMSHRYGYNEISLPMMEKKEVYHRTLGQTTDIISKETYSFTDRDGSIITLRPEFTASIARAFISNGLTQSLPQRLFSYGPLFRHERPQKCRYRQFSQINYELIGLDSYAADAELILLITSILEKLGIKNKLSLHINTLGDKESRISYQQSLHAHLSKYKDSLSENSREKLESNPLRILDSKNTQDKEIISTAPSIKEHLNKASSEHFESLIQSLDAFNIEYKIDSKLVRGLDYYTKTVFEFVSNDLGSQSAVFAGGRYDSLISMMGGPEIPAVGFAAGVDRIAALMDQSENLKHDLIMITALGDVSTIEALKCLEIISDLPFRSVVEYQKNIAKFMKKANRLNARFVLIVGDKEFFGKRVRIKDMISGTQEEIEVSNIKKFFSEHLQNSKQVTISGIDDISC